MELTNDFHVALPIERAWAVLTDLERIAPCMPGAQLQEVEGEEFRGVVKVKVGPMTAQYKGKARFLSQDADEHVAILRAEGQETRGQGTANATITARLDAAGGGTDVSLVTDLAITGRVAQFGRGVLADVSSNLLAQFVDCLEQTIVATDPSVGSETAAEPETAPEPEEVGATHSSDAGRAAEEDGEAESTDGDDDDPAARGDAGEPSIDEAQPGTVSEPESVATRGDAGEPSADEAPRGPVPEPERPAVRKIDSPEPQPVDLMAAAGSPVAKRVGPVLGLIAVAWLLKKLLGRKR